jgi:hypothetical protein
LGKLPHETKTTLHAENRLLFWPFAAQPDLRSMLLALLMPTQDHNAVVLAAIDRLDGMGGYGGHTIVPLFLADPFLHLQKTAATLRMRGLTRVIALPSVGQWGASFATSLDQLNLGVTREHRQVLLLRDLGLDPVQTICTQAPVPQLLMSSVVVVPALMDAEDPDAVQRKAEEVLSIAPGLSIHLLQAGPVLVKFNCSSANP